MEDNDLIRVFKALADKTRQDILELLADEEMNVTDICAEFKTSQPTISHHLQILRNCHQIASRKEGKNIYYVTKKDIVKEVFVKVVKKMRITIVSSGENNE